MDRAAFNAMLAQYATPEVSGDGRVSWDKGVRCVMPSVKLYGKCQQDGTPTPDAPVEIKCNNGTIICRGNTVLSNSNLFSGDFEWIQNTEKLWGLSESYKYTILHLKANTQYTIITPFGVYGKSKGFSSIYKSLNKNPVYHIYIQNAPSLCNQVTTLSTDDSGDVYLTYYGTSDPSAECVYREAYVVEGLCGQATAPGLMVAVDGSCQSTFDTQTGKLTDWWWPEIVLDGSEDEKWVAYTSSAFVGFRTGITALPEKMSRNAYWCNMLMPLAKQFTSTKPHLWCGVNTPVLFALASPTVGFPYYDETLDDFGLANWKAHLAENPMRVRVARNNPLVTYTEPQKLTQPPGSGQIIQLSGDVADCPITARYLTHS